MNVLGFVFAASSERSLTFLKIFCLWGPQWLCLEVWRPVFLPLSGALVLELSEAIGGLGSSDFLKPPESRQWVKCKIWRKMCEFSSLLLSLTQGFFLTKCVCLLLFWEAESLFFSADRDSMSGARGNSAPDPTPPSPRSPVLRCGHAVLS